MINPEMLEKLKSTDEVLQDRMESVDAEQFKEGIQDVLIDDFCWKDTYEDGDIRLCLTIRGNEESNGQAKADRNFRINTVEPDKNDTFIKFLKALGYQKSSISAECIDSFIEGILRKPWKSRVNISMYNGVEYPHFNPMGPPSGEAIEHKQKTPW